MESKFLISNFQCNVCNNQLLSKLGKIQGVFGVELLRSQGQIVVSHTDEVDESSISGALSALGFDVSLLSSSIEENKPSIWGCIL
jgi:hypothetical protein